MLCLPLTFVQLYGFYQIFIFLFFNFFPTINALLGFDLLPKNTVYNAVCKLNVEHMTGNAILVFATNFRSVKKA